jgi:NTP pyrophosphatase (non-canonical NTP hydrolase)
MSSDPATIARDFRAYCDWRMTKTLPRPPGHPEALSQATHELVGEVAELGELVQAIGTPYGPEFQRKLLSEVGDVFFCACWALDAWGAPWLLRDAWADPAAMAEAPEVCEAQEVGRAWRRDGNTSNLRRALQSLAFEMGVHAGLTADLCKKRLYQGREVPAVDPGTRLLLVLRGAATILALFDLTPSEALEANVRKLDARYPDGPAPGGGDRTGEGA